MHDMQCMASTPVSSFWGTWSSQISHETNKPGWLVKLLGLMLPHLLGIMITHTGKTYQAMGPLKEWNCIELLLPKSFFFRLSIWLLLFFSNAMGHPKFDGWSSFSLPPSSCGNISVFQTNLYHIIGSVYPPRYIYPTEYTWGFPKIGVPPNHPF